jgi:hypothetical protein
MSENHTQKHPVFQMKFIPFQIENIPYMSENHIEKHPVFQMKFILPIWIKNIPYISFFCEMKIHPIDI